MKRIIIPIVALALAGALWAQLTPQGVSYEVQVAKFLSTHISTTGTADIDIPLWTAPTEGYIPDRPRMVSASGIAAADSAVALNWYFSFIARDSAGTAASDTMAYWSPRSAVHGLQAAGKSYRMAWLSASTSRRVQKGDVISLRCEATGTTPTALTNVEISWVFIPTFRYSNPWK